ncbi:RNA-directed DNA polymerase, eukaryota, reverse transcriptase zinc-binding domain protein [Tanacetum coccineum]|uniref:RNA-directed DNA polymerase, eukaryota, reverse transcriptase zinc-binding domain protein n=1 Tax=Tanacetum coccineum TaxID=301880 RepID=A0ABQ5EFU1_9ASTR
MGRFRSKEDDVSKISTSIFVTNFPDSVIAKGSIPLMKFDGSQKNVENTVIGKSFVSVVKTSRMPLDKESPPAIVLEDDCFNEKDLTLSFMGKVKEMVSLVNLKKALCNEGFDVVKISYLRELWVLLEFETAKAKDSFRGFVSHSTKSFKIVFRGKVYWVRASEVLGWTPEFSEENEEDELSVEDNNDGRINDLEANIMGIVIESGVGRRCLKHCKQKLRFKAFRVTLKYSVLPLNGGSILNLMEEVVKWAKLWDIIMDGCAIKEITRDHGKSQENLGFDKPSVNRACIDTPFPVSLSIDQKEDMERRISKEEVKRAVWDCGVDKSPGPDGFSFSFYRHFWPVIEKDVFEAVDYFFMYGEIPNGCNSNFIALIPKILDANMVKDFRPISLIGSLYKIIAKILANRLVGVLGDLVNEVQSAFVADRQILDGPFILDEVLQWCRRKKKHALIFKVDFEKAFDSVRWDFVDDVLNKFGFGERWRTWIQSCLRSSRGSILVNGSPTEEFQFFRGLKQGDPLSPFLFILIMESLHISFQRVVDAGLFTGIKINSMVNLSHLFYADDAIFLGQWSELNIDSLVRVLDCFFRASGLRINMCKSKIMGVNVEDGMVKNAASKLGCLVLKTPFTYLGTKVGGNMSRKQAWKEVVDKVLSRLSRWKMKLLSIGGRLTLLKSVLGSMPIFHMSIFKVPSSILKSLESIRSRFFNGQDPKSNKASWVKWNKVLTPKDKGGLGVSSLFALNRGLMLKWVWRFYSQKCSLWTKVIKAIYGEDGNLNKDVSGGVRTCWTSIVHEVRVLQGRGINVADYIRLKLGNGENTRFWVDNWYEGGVIKELFPRMFALELNKNATVSSKLNASSLDNSFRRKARSGIEEMQLNSLAEISRMTTLVPCEDRYVWTLESDGVFSVASIRKEIDGNRFQDVSLPTRWVKSVPIKVNIIAWKVKSNALPTRFNISRRGMDIDSIVCPICNAGVESTNHIFFQCVVVRQIMRKISSWWNIDYSDVNSYEEWQVWLVSIRIQSKLKGVLEGVYYGLWWYMWNFRNKLLFDKKIPEKTLIFDNLVSSSFYWCKFRCKASFK